MISIVTVLIIALRISKVASQACPNSCSKNGVCKNPGRECSCFEGFTGADCSLKLCPQGLAWADVASGIDKAHNLAECSNMGLCDRTTGKCKCNTGFDGAACDRKICPGTTNNGPCSGNGKCMSMHNYALTKDPGLGTVSSYTSIWDAQSIYGCVCDTGYHGPDCSQRYCPSGDDPLTGIGADILSNPTQFNEIQMVTCKAGAGYFTLAFDGKTSANIPFNTGGTDLAYYLQNIPTLGPNTVKVALLGPQACSDSGASFTVEFLQNFGDIPLLVGSARFLTFSDAINTPNISVSLVQAGTKEDDPCSNRGICDAGTGYCTCAANYFTSNGYNAPGTRGDCGYTDTTILYCPGTLSCSAHGQCSGNPTYRCACSDGWTGADCSERSCPTDVSWFTLPSGDNEAHLYESVECGGMGICDRSSGTCICEPGFTGSSCNRMTCPGGTTVTASDADACNSNGKCYDMQTLATLATVNGDAAHFTYGLIPNNPLTWDATKAYGCYCDAGHGGYDCSTTLCPSGHNPDLVGPDYRDEQQVIACTDADGVGTISLTFRQKATVALQASANSATIKAALEALSTVGKVTVQPLDPAATDVLCSASGSNIQVIFLTDHGALPRMTATSANIDSVTISTLVPGTKESLPCSNRGLCDETTGQCSCFIGYGSSDGQGGIGTLNDCGYINPITIPIAN